MTETDPATDESVLIGAGIPATDKSFEFYLDMIGRQISDTLVDPANEWSQVFIGLVTGFHGTKRARTSGDSAGVRLAGRQLTIQAMMINEPPRGLALDANHPLMRFFAKADTVAALTTEVALMRAALAGTVTDYETMRARYGRTAYEGLATGAFDPGYVIQTTELGT